MERLGEVMAGARARETWGSPSSTDSFSDRDGRDRREPAAKSGCRGRQPPATAVRCVGRAPAQRPFRAADARSVDTGSRSRGSARRGARAVWVNQVIQVHRQASALRWCARCRDPDDLQRRGTGFALPRRQASRAGMVMGFVPAVEGTSTNGVSSSASSAGAGSRCLRPALPANVKAEGGASSGQALLRGTMRAAA